MTSVTLTRTVPVPPDEAWRVWTDPEELAVWWWPHLPDATYEWAPRTGASYAIASPSAGIGVQGVFTEVDEHRRLVCTWSWISAEPGEPVDDTVEISFEAAGPTATLVTVRHTSSLDMETEGSGLVQGWNAVLDRFAGSGQAA